MRVPTNIVSSICDDRGEEPTYNGVDMSTLIGGDHSVGDVISLLWFKRSLPKYATRFIDMCIMLCADHGPCVSGESPSPLFCLGFCNTTVDTLQVASPFCRSSQISCPQGLGSQELHWASRADPLLGKADRRLKPCMQRSSRRVQS